MTRDNGRYTSGDVLRAGYFGRRDAGFGARGVLWGLAVCGTLVLVAAAGVLQREVGAVQAAEAPRFEVDPLWPAPLPNHWLIGSAVGVAVDDADRVHVVHRMDSFNRRTEVGAAETPPTGDCCRPAPAVLVFDGDGTLVGHWGGPEGGSAWPASNHRLALASDGQIWVGGIGDDDVGFHRFAGDGGFAGVFGDSDAPVALARATDIAFDGGEAYVADAAARRVAVLDATTGAVKRGWGAYGRAADAGADVPAYAPDSPAATQFRNVHCVKLSRDGHAYVCDRESNRIQVFRTDGTYVTETVIEPATLGEGSVWDIAFSQDPQQSYMYVADGSNMKVHVLDRRSLDVLTSFGSGGRQPGQFFAVHSIATDSHGNVYTTETYEGKRVQKFVFRGVGPVPARDQGTVWPRR